MIYQEINQYKVGCLQVLRSKAMQSTCVLTFSPFDTNVGDSKKRLGLVRCQPGH